MWTKANIRSSFLAKTISVLLPVFILNLCILVPVPQTKKVPESSVSVTKKTPQRKKGKSMLAFVADYITDRNADIPGGNGSGLLEELNEVKEDWHHDLPPVNTFRIYTVKQVHASLTEPLFLFLEDARFSPPPEDIA